MQTMIIQRVLSLSATGTQYVPLPAVGSYRVKHVRFLPEAAVAASDSTYWSITCKATDGEAGTPGTAFVTWDTKATGGSALVVNTNIDTTITEDHAYIAGQGSIQVVVTKTSTPDPFSGTFHFELEKVAP